MLNETMRFLLSLTIAVMVLAGCSQPETPPSIVKLEKQYPKIKKKYVYQSLIRLANIKHDPDFEKLIKDVNKIVIYLPPREDSTYQIKSLRTEIRTDGYEELLDVRTADTQRISLWVKEAENKSHYLALVDTETDDIVLEIDGQINLEYLSALKMADQESLNNLLKGGF